MSDELSSIKIPVTPDPGKYQWLKGKRSGTDNAQSCRTHTFEVPHQMPGTIIFVHGVNSDGEWYFDASGAFAKGLNERLGRIDLEELVKDVAHDDDKVTAHRYLKSDLDGKRVQSPIIPFWWGYKASKAEQTLVDGSDQEGETPAHTDQYGNPLRTDGAWGGGPFQNGGAALTSFWQPTGFRKHVLAGLFDVNWINPIIGRTLCDCPPRLYYAHAARRLANLIKDIRKNLPNEPINIVSHSQGTIVALCSLFYLDGVRGPDTVVLNSSPYRFDTAITDYLTAADGRHSVQREPERIKTFVNAAEIVAKATEGYPAPPEPKAECTVEHKPAHAYDDVIYVHKPADARQWQSEIGGKVECPSGARGEDGKPWWCLPAYERDDTRGKLVVNFNPGDRVIGVSAVSGMGWRGIPTSYLKQLGDNVRQRMFARGTDVQNGDDQSAGRPARKVSDNPPVGSRTNYQQHYFFKQLEQVPASDGQGGKSAPQYSDEGGWRYLDGSVPGELWKIASEKILGLFPVLGGLSPRRNEAEAVMINAPLVPRPLNLPNNFDGNYLMYDGLEGKDPNGKDVAADKVQQEDFEDDVRYQERNKDWFKDGKGLYVLRYETWKEVETRRRNAVGRLPVSPTNHAAILRFKNDEDESSPVANVLSYDLTVGQGYAWHDENYWNYLLDLADWKKSDPYYEKGELPDSTKTVPPGIVIGDTLPAASQPRRAPNERSLQQ